ncbi:hypothetical protein ACQY1Q_11975 [Tenacibaculum sp. TC6]|uniref:hypothetical protein n=1 Tax=Tenacibaculum sp. TC6 TaxID=3423223 RepID=UPI003D36D083
MKKQILDLGKALKKEDQKEINGGVARYCYQSGSQCCESRPWGVFCDAGRCVTGGCLWY